MFDNSMVVNSAISSFNNAALFAPDFFWAAILALPIFAAFWIFAPNLKKYEKYVPAGAIVAIAIWLLTHGAYAALRDESVVAILVAACLFACSAFIARRLPEMKSHPFNKKWLPRADCMIGILAVGVAGILGAPGWLGFTLQGGAVAFGIFAGWLMRRQNRAEYAPELVVHLLITAIILGIIMQPEFFRFGQLGQLTILHILAVAVAGLVIVAHLVFKFAKPAGWLKTPAYKKLKLLTRLFIVLAFALFVITESALAFGLFAVMIAVSLFLSVRHAPKNADFEVLKRDTFTLTLAAFGLVTALPVFVCAAIVLWKSASHSKDVIIRYIK